MKHPITLRNHPLRSGVRSSCAIPALIVLAFSSLHVSTAAAADLTDLALEELLQVEVVSASRFAQSTTEAPATVAVIGETELRQRAYRNLGEALVTLPGVYSSNDRAYTTLGVRGFNRPGDYGSRILLLTDGTRRNDPIYDQAVFGNEAPIEIDWVKRLEFVSGPASAMYGSNALFGTVNAVMLNGGDVNGSRVTVDAGSNNSKRLGLVSGQRLDGDREWFFGFAAYKSNGANLYYPEYDSGTNNGQVRGLDGEGYQKGYGKFRWGNWQLSGNFSSRKKDIPTAWYGTTFGESGTRTLDTSHLVELKYQGDVVSGWQPSFRIFSGSYRYDGDYRYAAATDTRDRAIADWHGGEFHLAYTAIPLHKLMFGLDTQWNTRVEQRYFEVGTGNEILNTNNPSRRMSLFVQDEWRFHPDWLLNLGMRHDKNSDFAGVTSPRAALIWQATQRLTLKAMSGSAYRVPNAYERFYHDGGTTQTTNPNLQPEYITSSELAAAYRFGSGGRVGGSFYRNQMRDLIDQTTNSSNLLVYNNQNRVHAQGVEVDAENQWSGGYRLRGSLAWQESTLENGTLLVNSPRRMGKLAFGAPLSFGWTASGEALAVSARRGDNGPVAGYGILNLSLSSAPVARVGQVTVQVYNLGNRRYADPTTTYMAQRFIEQDGRQFRVRWSMAF